MGSVAFFGDGGPAISASLNIPSGVAVDTAGIITTVAGRSGPSEISGDGGPATSAILNFPPAVALFRAGNFNDAGRRFSDAAN